uniref:Uncharacterized protein n=1 Tax=Rhizophora mucronata TaxID=61149 RepID=A0A2P2NJ78_RHIMU
MSWPLVTHIFSQTCYFKILVSESLPAMTVLLQVMNKSFCCFQLIVTKNYLSRSLAIFLVVALSNVMFFVNHFADALSGHVCIPAKQFWCPCTCESWVSQQSINLLSYGLYSLLMLIVTSLYSIECA